MGQYYANSVQKDEKEESLGSAETFAPAVVIGRQPFDHWAFIQLLARRNSRPNRRETFQTLVKKASSI
jgi:hypothetical protein